MKQTELQNPLLSKWAGALELPPFEAIKPDHFRPAFDRALADHCAEIDAIAENPALADFENTIGALERSGRALERVASVFFVLAGILAVAAVGLVRELLVNPLTHTPPHEV